LGAQQWDETAKLTLADALARAERANAHLPVAALNVSIAQAQLRENQRRNKPGIALDGDVHLGGPLAYTSSDARFQVIGIDTVFDGGRVRSSKARADHLARGARAGFRTVVKDVDLNVRLRFTEGLHAEQLLEIRRSSLQGLQSFLSLVEAQARGGIGVASDVLRTRTRVAAEEANIADAERAFDEAEIELNDLMGRPPREPLALAPLPPPVRPITPDGQPWRSVPDILEAEANAAAAQAAIGIARADRRPAFSITADVGRYQPIGNQSTGTGLNPGQGNGGQVVLGFNWPVFDLGVFRARLAQAELLARQTADSVLVVRRQSELEWSRAVAQTEDIYRVFTLRSRSVPIARDAYLFVESSYRGGIGTALDVIDAYSAWVDAQVAEADAILDYRQAEARLIRWGTP
jgi:outer membrane protein TolC